MKTRFVTAVVLLFAASAVALYVTGMLCRVVPDDAAFAAAYDASVTRLLDGLLTP